MNQKLLLSSTALVGAGLLLAPAAQAQEQEGFTVEVSGFTEFGVTASEGDLLTGSDRGYDFFMDNELIVRATNESDSGITYGSKAEIELDSGAASDGNAEVDEVGLFLSGAFGRIELGRDDGAEDVMFVGGEDVQAGTGGFDGDTANLTALQIDDTSDAAKATYFTPRIAGFQLGASFVPDEGDDGGDDTGGDFENSIGFGANFTGEFAGLDLTVAAVGITADAEADGDDDKFDYSIGLNTGFAGIDFGAAFIQRTDADERDIFNVGLGYGFGPVNASVGYVYNDPEDGEDVNLFAVSADVGILPGVVLKGDFTFNDETDGASGDDSETSAGVVTIQVNY